jgi:hypothetical protein
VKNTNDDRSSPTARLSPSYEILKRLTSDVRKLQLPETLCTNRIVSKKVKIVNRWRARDGNRIEARIWERETLIEARKPVDSFATPSAKMMPNAEIITATCRKTYSHVVEEL